ncbi:dicarboxylate/amino acid:cation symporter [Peptoniphilus sp. MSJ-1]|uniref:Dicarboxylate/amino acid:cation symporter n=1 Tax=Peptoniphilus ovalis TaxID=2841503 RepID=A0ABS6FH29_9FIRM|nr:dicarboxylate/amino acid:cation symporter [Peptoniphilus ovalis]MBU5668535.1 dicarboxylate/amino acid:cation symporter [Peptoniphilus ovalis]
MKEKKKIGLIPKLIIAIILGTLVGLYLPDVFTVIGITFSKMFGAFLNFLIPLMIIAFVGKGIADLSEGAGKLLGVTVLLAYASTLVAGSASYFMSNAIFPSFITTDLVDRIQAATSNELKPLFEIPLSAFIDVTAALVLAFMLGLCVSILRSKGSGEILYKALGEFSEVINLVLAKFVIPILPFYIFGNFTNLAKSGSVFAILGIFGRIFVCIIGLHLIYLTILFIITCTYAGKNPFKSIRLAVPAYLTAVGTQSSAASIPVNVNCNKNIGVTKQIRDFVIPLCATVHMPGSMITITGCVYTLLTMFDMPHSYGLMIKFIAILGVAMVAAPGAPGGAVMSALPFLPVVGVDPASTMATILITLYITQDSFGTAANVTGDNAISVAVEKIYYDHIVKRPKPTEEFE